MMKCPSCTRCSSFYVAKDGGRTHKRPLLLTCGHTFCESCLLQLAKERKISIVCPTCSVETALTAEEGVRSLCPDRYMIGLVHHNQKVLLDQELSKLSNAGMHLALRKRAGSGDTGGVHSVELMPDKMCNECIKRQATSHCEKCDCNMCGFCFEKVHKMSNTLRQHQAVPLTPDGQLELSQTCKIHETRPIEYYCEDDDTIICSRCVIVGNHKGHNISSIEDKNKLIVSEMEPNLQMAVHVQRRLKKIDKELVDLMPDSKREVGPALEDVAKHFQYLHGVLQVREQLLERDILNAYRAGVEPAESLRAELANEYKQLDLAIKAAQRIINNNDEVIVNAKEILNKLNHARDIPCVVERSALSDTTENISFVPGTPIDDMLLQHGAIVGSVTKRFTMCTLRDRPEKFTEDTESLGSTTPADTGSVVSTVSEDVVIEDEQVIMEEDSLSRQSDDSSVSSASKGRTKQAKSKTKKTAKKTVRKGQTEKVFVTHIRNPCSFVVQLKPDSAKLTTLSYSMNDWCKSSVAAKHQVTGVDQDDLVLCKYTQDQQWYRARIKNVMPSTELDKTTVEVVYIDYGNTEVVPVSRLRNMQARFMKHPPFSLECCLFNIVPNDKSGCWSAEAVQTFAKMVENRPLLLRVVREENNILQVDLSKPGDEDIRDDTPVSVRDALVFLELANFETPQSVPVPGGAPASSRNFLNPEPAMEGQNYNVVVSYAGTPDSFYVQELGEESQYLANMMAKMQETYSHSERDSWKLFCPQLGMICVSQFSGDGMWYRAKVVGLPGGRLVDVVYVDYGNIERVSVLTLRKILDTYMILPSQAIRCSLMDVEPNNLNENWTEKGLRYWSELVTMKKFVMKVLEVGVCWSVVLREVEADPTDSINVLVVEAGHGRSVGKWSEAKKYDASCLEPGLTYEVPRLTYTSGGNTSFPQAIKTKNARSGKPVSRRAHHSPVLTPPSSPELSSSRSEVSRPSRSSSKTNSISVVQSSPHSRVTVSQASPEKPVKQSSITSPSPTAAAGTTPKKKAEKKTEVEVVISHFESPSDFFVQLADSVEKMNGLMNNMADAYRNTEVSFMSWEKDQYCAALSPRDHRWYRARILQLLQNKLFEVVMIDFGIKEVVPGGNLRRIEKDFRRERCFSFRCHLVDLIPAGGSGSWSKTACEFMQEQTRTNKLFINKKGGVQGSPGEREKTVPIDLIVEEYIEETALEPGTKLYSSLIDRMKEKGLAIPVKSKTSKIKETPKTDSDDETEVLEGHLEVPDGPPEVPEGPPEAPKVHPVLYYEKAVAPKESQFRVLIVYVDFNGTIYFYTMGGDEPFKKMLENLKVKFEGSEADSDCQPWEEGQACVCYYSVDDAWCRATILAVESHRVQVRYVDFGNTEWVSYNKLRADVKDFLNLPVQAYPCVLHDLLPVSEDGQWPEQVLEYVHKQLVNKYCYMEVIERVEDKPLSVKLKIKDKDVASTLVQYGMAQRGIYISDEEEQSQLIHNILQKQNPFKPVVLEPVGEMMSVLVTHVDLPSVVYVQRTRSENIDKMPQEKRDRVEQVVSDLDSLFKVSKEINTVAPSLPTIFMAKPGLACCAQYQYDERWYRAVIVEVFKETEQILVLFVDYGNSEFVTPNKIRSLPPHYAKLPAQGIRCHLADLVPPEGSVSWTIGSLRAMAIILTNKPILALIRSHKPLTVELYKPELREEDTDKMCLVYQSVVDAGKVQLQSESSLFDEAVCGDAVSSAADTITSEAKSDDEDDATSNDTKDPKSWAEMVEDGETDFQSLAEFDDDDDADVVIEAGEEISIGSPDHTTTECFD